MKLQSDPLIVIVATVAIAGVFGFQRIYLGRWTEMRGNGHPVPQVRRIMTSLNAQLRVGRGGLSLMN